MVVETMRKEKLSQYQVLSIENRLNEGRYVPVWEFIYWIGKDNEQAEEERMYFNAVDGSYVEPRLTNTYLLSIMP